MFPYRCSRRTCRTRISLPRKLQDYIRVPKCRDCGGELSIDKCRMRNKKLRLSKRTDPGPTCECDGAHYPHRKGSVELCSFARIKNN